MQQVVYIFIFSIFISCNSRNKPIVVASKTATASTYDAIKVLPQASYYDTDLELEFLKATNSYQKKFKATEVLITSKKWSSTFNESGLVIARSRNATVLVYQKGACFLQEVIFEQKSDGKNFKEAKITAHKEWLTFDCNMMKNKNPDITAGVK